MTKNIKTREHAIDIKTKGKVKSMNHYIKQHTITRKTIIPKENDFNSNDNSTAESQATDSVITSANLTSLQSAEYIKSRMVNKRNISSKTNLQNASKMSPKFIENSIHLKNTNTSIYQSFMKTSYVQKYKFDHLSHPFISGTNKSFMRLTKLSSKLIQVSKSIIFSSSNLFTCGFGLILTLVIILFIGVFSSFSNSPVYASSYLPLSNEVLEHTSIITKYAEEYGISEYIPLIQAIMMHETSGIGSDPMNASSFPINIDFPLGITDTEYSIHIGIQYLSDCLHAAGVQSAADTNNLYLAIQGYDFGIDYIYWVKTNFNGYSKFNAQVYYEEFNPSYSDINYVENVLQYINLSFGTIRLEPNFDNPMAWGGNNPYSKKGLYGQCTWFAWGRFYEIYGFDPGFRGDGWNCAQQLVTAYPDKFELSSEPQVGAIFSCIGRNHVGIVVGWDGINITIQEGNLDRITNSFTQAKSDWQTVTYDLDKFRRICDGVVFACYSNK